MTIHYLHFLEACAHPGMLTSQTFWRETGMFCYVIFKFLLMSIFILKKDIDIKCIDDSIRHFICFLSL